MEDINNGEITIEEKSYNYVKGILYGFKGWDKYILTEDNDLKEYLEFLLKDKAINKKYKIIYIGAATNVVDLMDRNSEEEFFESAKNIISVLDGDQKEEEYCKNKNNVFFIPFDSVEKALFSKYNDNSEFNLSVNNSSGNKYQNPKKLYENINNNNNNKDDIFEYLNNFKIDEVKSFVKKIITFLNKN